LFLITITTVLLTTAVDICVQNLTMVYVIFYHCHTVLYVRNF